MSEEVQLAFAVHDKSGDYVRHAAVAMMTVFFHTEALVHVHILHDETLLTENKKRLKDLCQKYKQKISFHLVKVEIDKQKYPALEEFSIGIMFRLKIMEILPKIDKVIYLDTDIICTLDIGELWQENIDNSLIGVIADPCTYKLELIPNERMQFYQKVPIMNRTYFNSGVLYLNLKEMRTQKINLFSDCMDFLNKYVDSTVPDQDALNFLFQQKGKFLNEKYNRLVPYHKGIGRDREKWKNAIWHFAGHKPWARRSSPLDALYWLYLRLTPWADEYDIGTIYDTFIYNGEFSLLQFRLSSMYEVVDAFILITVEKECEVIDEIKQHCPEFFDKIIILASSIPKWFLEDHNQNKILENCLQGMLQGFLENDLILVSDINMIPSRRILEQISALREVLIRSPLVFEQEGYNRSKNVFLNVKRNGTIISRRRYIESITALVEQRERLPKIHSGGIYFCD